MTFLEHPDYSMIKENRLFQKHFANMKIYLETDMKTMGLLPQSPDKCRKKMFCWILFKYLMSCVQFKAILGRFKSDCE